MQNSLNADNDYHAWLADLVSSGATCGPNPNQDSNYVAAVSADSAATTSKQAFVAIWDPMAPPVTGSRPLPTQASDGPDRTDAACRWRCYLRPARAPHPGARPAGCFHHGPPRQREGPHGRNGLPGRAHEGHRGREPVSAG